MAQPFSAASPAGALAAGTGRAGLVLTLNAAALAGLTGVLLAAYVFQFALGELPCPLCMLQRVAFALLACGFLLNVTRGARPLHYAMVLLSAGYGMAVSGRQVLLHVVPGSGAYGSALFGLHLYSWAFILFAAAIPGTAALLALHGPDCEAPPGRPGWLRIICWAAASLVLLNAVTSLLQCGPVECSDNPVGWWIGTVLR